MLLTADPLDGTEGVYFNRRDYAGVGRRLVCGVIDFVVLWTLWVMVFILWLVLIPVGADKGLILASAWMSIGFGYLAALKRTRLRTLGYCLTGLKVVNLRGERPSLKCMAVRSGMLLFGSTFLLVDLLSVLANDDRQKISDMIAGTYVVRTVARPAGRGRLVSVVRCLWMYFLVYREVHRAARP